MGRFNDCIAVREIDKLFPGSRKRTFDCHRAVVRVFKDDRLDPVLAKHPTGSGIGNVATYTGPVRLLNRKGEVLLGLWVETGNGFDFRYGRARLVVDRKTGFIDEGGLLAVVPTFDNARPFAEGLARVDLGGKEGVVDPAGRLVVPPQYRAVSDFSEGLAAVHTGTAWGYIDQTGRVAIEPRFARADPFSDGLAIVSVASTASTAGRTFYIDKTGQEALTPPKGIGLAAFREGLAPILMGLLDETAPPGGAPPRGPGVVLLPPVIDLKRNIGLMDKTGKVVAETPFEMVEPFSEGLAAVRIHPPGGREAWGYIDRTGRLVIEPIFCRAEPFHEGAAVVSPLDSNSVGYIDPEGQWLIKPSYANGTAFHRGVAAVLAFGTWACIDKKGREVPAEWFRILDGAEKPRDR